VFNVVQNLGRSRIDRNLIVIAANRSNQAKLICRGFVEDNRAKAAEASGLVMDDLWDWGLEAQVRAISGEAAVICKPLAVISEADLVICVVVASVTGDELALAVALKSRTGNYVENAVCTVSVLGGISAALNFEIIDVLGIELWTHVRGNAGIGDGNAIEQPGDLVASSDVQLVVNHIGAGYEVGNHGHAVGL